MPPSFEEILDNLIPEYDDEYNVGNMEDYIYGESDDYLYQLYADWFNATGGGLNYLTAGDMQYANAFSSLENQGNDIFWGGNIENVFNPYLGEENLQGFDFESWINTYGQYIPSFGSAELTLLKDVNKLERESQVRESLGKLSRVSVGSELYSHGDLSNQAIRDTALGIDRLKRFQNTASLNQLFGDYESDLIDAFGYLGGQGAFSFDPTTSEYITSGEDYGCEQLCEQADNFQGNFEDCLETCASENLLDQGWPWGSGDWGSGEDEIPGEGEGSEVPGGDPNGCWPGDSYIPGISFTCEESGYFECCDCSCVPDPDQCPSC